PRTQQSEQHNEPEGTALHQRREVDAVRMRAAAIGFFVVGLSFRFDPLADFLIGKILEIVDADAKGGILAPSQPGTIPDRLASVQERVGTGERDALFMAKLVT